MVGATSRCAVGDLFMARADGSPQRLYSLSAQIQCEQGLLRTGYDPSITRATSPWHSAHLPTSSKSPRSMVPLKLVIVVS